MATIAAQIPQQISPGDDPNKRLKDVTIVKPIIYGNVAKYFGKKRESDGHTHEWKVYIKPYYKEDLAKYIKKVSFKLHESYPVNVRILTKPPFEISETGWGEFELVIKIYFHDPNERPVTLYHMLKLFKTKDAACDATNSLLYNEFYEEIIFNEPTLTMYKTLSSTVPHTPASASLIAAHSVNFESAKASTLRGIIEAKKRLEREIGVYKDKVNMGRELIVKLKTDIASSKQEREGV
ncbi:YEATS domain-containing protein 4 [Diaphorina citri]|uniref:YEATS domain-containing protein 4 n=1 Tax=Diaphorina citri TaxID=121845 RepID=A0A3Q0JA98_DIACI|nr:YEATS domain-containing protein 4 [Diaphorina citri]KAI5694392.1 hypothetical protein M8J75_016058 [Diaphorina citri]KAI5713614.1 hypothetical protein M8J76_002246 [Diaphorina citri]